MKSNNKIFKRNSDNIKCVEIFYLINHKKSFRYVYIIMYIFFLYRTNNNFLNISVILRMYVANNSVIKENLILIDGNSDE
ncbi:hypothetical protein HZS_5532 [Henneguya salminicola]|nr:hypothetical protein HZS_5532 [Henneguya salminicola]